ncbi:MAG: hypothetical protein WC785_00510 [Tatlockia sp.]|jgi:hypothetical protein
MKNNEMRFKIYAHIMNFKLDQKDCDKLYQEIERQFKKIALTAEQRNTYNMYLENKSIFGANCKSKPSRPIAQSEVKELLKEKEYFLYKSEKTAFEKWLKTVVLPKDDSMVSNRFAQNFAAELNQHGKSKQDVKDLLNAVREYDTVFIAMAEEPEFKSFRV